MADITGTAGDDSLVGTEENDEFLFSLGNDTLIGGAGRNELVATEDTFLPDGTVVDLASGTITAPGLLQSISDITQVEAASAQDVTLRGDDLGNYFILSGGNGTLEGGAGNDTLALEASGGAIIGGTGDDKFEIVVPMGDISVEGGSGVDELRFYDPFSSVSASINDLGQVVLNYRDRSNITLLDEIEDIFFYDARLTNAEFVPVQGTEMGELITGRAGTDVLNALGGNDWILATTGNDIIDGGTGSDMLSFVDQDEVVVNLRSGAVTLNAGPASDQPREAQTASNVENVTGSSGRDLLIGDDGANVLRGLGGNDAFSATAGGDMLVGGAGLDRLHGGTFDDLSDVSMSLLRGRIWSGEGAGTQFTGIEQLITWGGDDQLTGDHAANTLNAGEGNDTLMGNGGDDLLYGGLGDDLALYGFDQDQYAITTRENGVTEVAYIGASTGDGTDLLVSIETLRFADGDLVL